jgi:PPOX class probable F420-dependent enzyme
MSNLNDPDVRALLEAPNFAVISTHNEDGSVHSTVVWMHPEDGALAVNSAIGRRWPSNLQRDPRATVVVADANNPYRFVEIRGRASAITEGAEQHIDALAKKYLGQDTYPFRQPGERRIKFLIAPERVRLVKQ